MGQGHKFRSPETGTKCGAEGSGNTVGDLGGQGGAPVLEQGIAGRAVTRHIHAHVCARALSPGKPGSLRREEHRVLARG